VIIISIFLVFAVLELWLIKHWINCDQIFALSLKNELQCHCLNVRINSGDDVATSCKNLVNFYWVTPEITELICIPRYLYLAKIDLHISIRRAAIQKRHAALERWAH